MLRTFKAVLKGNSLEWVDEAPEQGERPIEVHVTLLEEESRLDIAERGNKMAEVLEKLAAGNTFAEVSNPVAWQREVRQDRALPDRNEYC